MDLDDKKGVVGGIAEAADDGFDGQKALSIEIEKIMRDIEVLRDQFKRDVSEVVGDYPGAFEEVNYDEFTYRTGSVDEVPQRVFLSLVNHKKNLSGLLELQRFLEGLRGDLEGYEFGSELDYLIVRAYLTRTLKTSIGKERAISEICGDFRLQCLFDAMKNPAKNIKDEDAIMQQKHYRGSRKIKSALMLYAQGVIDAYLNRV